MLKAYRFSKSSTQAPTTLAISRHEKNSSKSNARSNSNGPKTLETSHCFDVPLSKAPTLQILRPLLAQSTGVLVINIYQLLVYNKLGLYETMSLLLCACFDTWASAMNSTNSMILDQSSRIRILAISIIACAFSIIPEVVTYAEGGNKVGNGFRVLFIYIFVTFYNGCMDSSEIFPTLFRVQGVGFFVSGFFLITLVYIESAPTTFDNIGWNYHLVFIFIPLLYVIIPMRYLSETKGLTFEEVVEKFGNQVALDIDQVTD